MMKPLKALKPQQKKIFKNYKETKLSTKKKKKNIKKRNCPNLSSATLAICSFTRSLQSKGLRVTIEGTNRQTNTSTIIASYRLNQ